MAVALGLKRFLNAFALRVVFVVNVRLEVKTVELVSGSLPFVVYRMTESAVVVDMPVVTLDV